MFHNYLVVTLETEKWNDLSSELDGFCDACNRDVFLKIHSRSYLNNAYGDKGLPIFIIYLIECPRCRRRSFIYFVLLSVTELVGKDKLDEDEYKTHYELYELFTLPIREESYINKDIPDQYSSLKESISEAIFNMSHCKFISSAIMFRRALQIITKEILGGKGKTLHKQLDWLKENENLMKIDLTNLFHDNAKLIKDVCNQAAHPEEDITLQQFSKEDVNALHDLFLIIINEIFVKPAQLKKNQEELIQNRKLKQ